MKTLPEVLMCPHCGFDYLHHSTVEVYDRSEDEKTGLCTVAGNRQVSTTPGLRGNPSSRRDGIRIWFRCEGCDKESCITIAQHKGRTLIDYRGRP